MLKIEWNMQEVARSLCALSRQLYAPCLGALYNRDLAGEGSPKATVDNLPMRSASPYASVGSAYNALLLL